ncbi:MAG TPA: M67 family metallopeptidase [Sphingobium sp.]|nr:M67 family metallopeptidase [Sphingobium sp.]
MNLIISTALLDAIRAHADAAGDEECCGLLLGDRAAGAVASISVSAIRPAANVAANPRHFFEIDPALLLRSHREARAGGPAILGYYHSHPDGAPVPSPVDAAMAQGNGDIWLIVGRGGAVRAWRATPAGALHGRFDSVPLTEHRADHPAADRRETP